jgi:hypothetical protein
VLPSGFFLVRTPPLAAGFFTCRMQKGELLGSPVLLFRRLF